jgi:heme oxygenase (biliverdin-IX-beta and delta-forming)
VTLKCLSRKAIELRGNAHETLWRHTRHLHDALDARLVLSNLASRTGYIDYLLINWACVPIEHALERAGIDQVLPDWERRRRRNALLTDLEALGVPLPSCAALAIDSDVGSLLGWSYVLEGSRLGASVILQTVKRSSGPEIARATGFLRHGDGERLWESFKIELNKINLHPLAITMACTGATEAFQRFAPLKSR